MEFAEKHKKELQQSRINGVDTTSQDIIRQAMDKKVRIIKAIKALDTRNELSPTESTEPHAILKITRGSEVFYRPIYEGAILDMKSTVGTKLTIMASDIIAGYTFSRTSVRIFANSNNGVLKKGETLAVGDFGITFLGTMDVSSKKTMGAIIKLTDNPLTNNTRDFIVQHPMGSSKLDSGTSIQVLRTFCSSQFDFIAAEVQITENNGNKSTHFLDITNPSDLSNRINTNMGVKFLVLSDLTVPMEEGAYAAAISLNDNSSKQELDSFKIRPGQNKQITVDGNVYQIHINLVVPGITFGIRAAAMTVFDISNKKTVFSSIFNSGESLQLGSANIRLDDLTK